MKNNLKNIASRLQVSSLQVPIDDAGRQLAGHRTSRPLPTLLGVGTSMLVLAMSSGTANASGSLNILTVGPNYGNAATTNYVPTTGSPFGGVSHLGSTVSKVNESGFNALTASQLATYDVVLTQWASSNATDLSSPKVQSYVFNGGALFLDGDFANYNDLDWVGITGAQSYCSGPWTFTAAADPVLTDKLPATPRLANCHGNFPNFDPSVFMVLMKDRNGLNAALAGKYGTGRIILTGPDQDYHAHPGTQQYQLLLNELEWTGNPAPLQTPFRSHAAIAGGAINIAAGSTVNGDLAAQAAVVLGANSVVHNIYAGAAVTTGALSTVENIFSGAATTAGANADAQNIHAGAAITVGASGTIEKVYAGAAITLGAGASTNGVLAENANSDEYAEAGDIHNSVNMTEVIAEITETQAALSALEPSSANIALSTTMGTRDLAPGVWEGSAVSIAASSTITFDASHDHVDGDENLVWVINLSEALTVGADTHFETSDLAEGHTATIIWNVGAAVNLGAGTSFRGTAFVGGAVTAATSSVSCGHLYAKAAISIGSIGVDSDGTPVTCENSDAVFTYLETLD
jgi:hypothetical protein